MPGVAWRCALLRPARGARRNRRAASPVHVAGHPARRAQVAVFYSVLGYAVEMEELSANSLDRVKWKPPKVAEVVDRRVVVNPRQARELLTAVTYVGRPWRGRHLRAFFACMYFAALRPGEVKALRKDGCYLPAIGWGRLTLSRSRPQSNKRWTDSGEAFDDRGLKHRADDDTRAVPIPPELVTVLREHIEEFGTAADGRLFRTATGGMIFDTTHTWAVARTLAMTPEQVASPLAARPYDLRHAAVSLWLNGGVAATEVANRAGHSVEVLLRCTRSASTAARRPLTGGSMTHWPPDRSTMQGSRSRRDPSFSVG